MNGESSWYYDTEGIWTQGHTYNITAYAVDASGCESDEDEAVIHIFNPSIYIEKTVGEGQEELMIQVDTEFTFSIYVENDGDVELNDIDVYDYLPLGVVYMNSATMSYNGEPASSYIPDVNGNELLFSLDPLAAGEYATIQFNATVTTCDISEENVADVYAENICDSVYGTDNATVIGECGEPPEEPPEGSGATIDPDTITVTMCPGESIEEHKTVTLDEIPIGKLDVMFLFDLTGSMGGVIDSAKADSITMMADIQAQVADSAFGIGSFMDYPGSFDYCDYSAQYGDAGSGDYAWSLDQDITTNTGAVSTAINGLSLGWGADEPEAYTRALYESLSVDWRLGARKVVIIFEDNDPHECDMASYGCGSSTGVDPGPDAIAGTSDDLSWAGVVADLEAAGISVVVVESNSWGCPDIWQYAADETGGIYASLGSPGTLADEIVALIEDVTGTISYLTFEPKAGFEDWFDWDPESYTDVEGGESVEFDVTITVPPGTELGEYHLWLMVMGDGSILAVQEQFITVEECAECEPDMEVTKYGKIVYGDEWLTDIYAEELGDIVEFNTTIHNNEVDCCDIEDISVYDVLDPGLMYYDDGDTFFLHIYKDDTELVEDVDFTFEQDGQEVWWNFSEGVTLAYCESIYMYYFAEVVDYGDWTNLVDVTANCGDQVLEGSDEAYAHLTEETEIYDFGDAPDSYSTLLASDGARHLPFAPYMGVGSDLDLDGQPTANADGDDNDGNDDEDGVTFSYPWYPGGIGVINVDMATTPVPGYLNAWVDFNQDGDWADAGEHVSVDLYLTNGMVHNGINFNVPAGALIGDTYARFRINATGGLSYDGEAGDGEVEDYVVTIEEEPCDPTWIVTKETWCYDSLMWYDYGYAEYLTNTAQFRIILNNTGSCAITDPEIIDQLPLDFVYTSDMILAPAGVPLDTFYVDTSTNYLYWNFTGVLQPGEQIGIIFWADYIGGSEPFEYYTNWALGGPAGMMKLIYSSGVYVNWWSV